MTVPYLLCLDTESTGTDVFNDRVVTCFIGVLNPEGNWSIQQNWLIDSGIEIPAGATAVHGITNEMAQQGKRPAEALAQIASILTAERGLPLVLHNAAYDLTLLLEEFKRHGVQFDGFERHTIIDTLVADKGLDKYRKGSRKLVDVAAHYGVPVEENAHDAAADSLMAGRVALQILKRTGLSPRTLHERSAGWKSEQAKSLQSYFRSPKGGGNLDAVVDPGWPIASGVAA